MNTSPWNKFTHWPAWHKKFSTWRRSTIKPNRFRLLFTFYQREDTYSLALAALSAYVKREIPGVQVSLLAVSEGDDVGNYVRKALQIKPHLIAVSAMDPTWLPILPFLEALKESVCDTPVIVGGYRGIFSPADTLAHPAVNYACVGDGEIPLVSLINRIRGVCENGCSAGASLPGLWEKKTTGEILKSPPVLTEDLENMPFPDYSIFEQNGEIRWLSRHAIESKNLTTMPVMSGRGCPYRCTYCSNTSLLNLFGQAKLLRKYDPEKMVDELTRLKHRYSVQFFQFMDETFTFDKKYAYRLLELYREKVRLPFSCFARVEQMEEEFCRVAAAAGCHSMWFGVESGSEEYRKRYLGRRMTNRQIIQAAETARKHGIKRMTFNMVGLPFESRENILDTLELTKTIRPELAIFSQFLPLPGTPLYKVAAEAGLLLQPSEKQQMWSIGDLNIREDPDGVDAGEFKSLVNEIMNYLWESNRYDDGPSISRVAMTSSQENSAH